MMNVYFYEGNDIDNDDIIDFVTEDMINFKMFV